MTPTARCGKKHVKLQPHIEEGIQDTIKELGVSHNTLGVHFRGQEMRTALGQQIPPNSQSDE